ncbi:MAG: terminase small subunit [Proteobacteria bacterium]|nr:terminase small subunit [Pseudomonadota bacterium]
MEPPIPRKLLTPRQERFCHAFVHYANASEAAWEAGYARGSTKQQGYRLLRTERVRARIRALHAQLCRDQGQDTEVLIGKLENVYRRAIEEHQFHTAARAVELQARLSLLKEGRMAVPRLPPLPPAPPETAARPACLRRSEAPASRRQALDIVAEAETLLGRAGGGGPGGRALTG